MEWTITLNEEDQYTEIITRGIADRDGSLEMAKTISLALRKSKINKILIDHTNITAASGGILEIYNRPKEFEKIGVSRGIRVAEVVKREHRQLFDFLETVCLNRGFSFSVFEEKQIALEWLLKP